MGEVGLKAALRTHESTTSTGVRPWPRRRRAALGITWAMALVVFCVVRGIPTVDRITVAIFLVSGLLVATVGTARGGWRVLRDWVPVLVLFLLYDISRGAADTLGMPVHVTEMASADLAMFGVLPTNWLQDQLYDPAVVHWWDVGVAFVYFSHFVVVWVVAAALYLRSRHRWVDFTARLLTLTFAGLLTYVLYPAAPPWLAAELGETPPLSRISARGWDEIGLHGAGRLVEIGQVTFNPVAAVPSLHAAFSLLVVVFFWSSVRSTWGRALMAAYPLAMAFTLVYGGEHYVIDILLGWLYVAVVFALVGYGQRWLARSGKTTQRRNHRSRPFTSHENENATTAPDSPQNSAWPPSCSTTSAVASDSTMSTAQIR